MKKIWLIVLPALVVLATILYLSQTANPKPQQTTPQFPTPTPSSVPVEFTANFEIYTLGTKRVFTSPMYHNLSKEVYISSENPNQVHVYGTGITWGDFFSTLPMKLTKDCLTTGTKQVFCANNSYKLKFSINGSEDPDALDKEILRNDILKVTYD